MLNRYLYIMISHTDTGVAKAIRKFSGYRYNHVALTLDPTLRTWFSFARFYRTNPLYGGFVAEPVERYLAKTGSAPVRIFRIEIPESRAVRLALLCERAGGEDTVFVYNLFDIIFTLFGSRLHIKGAYTCLEFISSVLGKEFDSIRELDEYMNGALFYEGDLNSLTYDSGARTNMYFSRIGVVRGSLEVMKLISLLTIRSVKRDREDIVLKFLNEEGI